MTANQGVEKSLKASVVGSISYMFFAIFGIIAGLIASSLMSILGLVSLYFVWGLGGVEVNLAALSILGMSFLLGIELAKDITAQFTDQLSGDAGVLESVDSIEPEEPDTETETAPLELLSVFLWMGIIVVFSVYAGKFVLGTPYQAWAVPVALLYGVIEIGLAMREVPGPALLLTIIPLTTIYAFAGITRQTKDMLPQYIFFRHFPNLLRKRYGKT